MKPIDADWYDREYFEGPTKSTYQPYGPGDWADWLVDMVTEKLNPTSVLDVGCAYGFTVERLLRRNIQAWGFDHSDFAVRSAGLGPDRIWRGDVADVLAWRDADLILCTEVLEHLTDTQAHTFFRHAYAFGDRVLILVTTIENQHADEDESHINLKTIAQWSAMAAEAGWDESEHRSQEFNQDWRSEKMDWAGRFMFLYKPYLDE